MDLYAALRERQSDPPGPDPELGGIYLRTLRRVSGEEHLGIREVLRIPEIRAAMLGTFVVMLGFGILAPVLPNYARSFGVGYDAVGLLISAFSFARLVSDPFVGRFIDRYG